MKKFQNPELEVMEIAVEDIITTSGCVGYNPNCGYETVDPDCPRDR